MTWNDFKQAVEEALNASEDGHGDIELVSISVSRGAEGVSVEVWRGNDTGTELEICGTRPEL